MMNCVAVDDEKLVLDLIVDNIRRVPFLKMVARCKNAMETAELLHKESVDLLFLDVQMPGINGLQFLKTLKNPPLVILITAYREHALECFELDAVDYLLKPVSFERFLKACNKAYELFRHRQSALNQKLSELSPPGDASLTALKVDPEYFFVYVEYNQVKITISEILYIEAMKDYVKIFLSTNARPVITKMSLKMLEEHLKPFRFARVHKSYIVSANKVTAIKRDLICIGKHELPFSETYKSAIESLFRRLN